MAMTSSYFDQPVSPLSDDETVSQRIGKIMSPTSAAELVGPPPDSPPPHQPGQSTPLTGTLARAPLQAVAKNLDKPESMGSYNTPQNLTGVSTPPDDGNVRSIVSPQSVQPAQGIRPAQPIQPAQQVRPNLMSPNRSALVGPGTTTPVVSPVLPAQAPPSQLNLAQNRLNTLTSAPGISGIKNGFVRGAARFGDALAQELPGIGTAIPGTTPNRNLQIARQQGIVGNLEQQETQASQRQDIASQATERTALADKAATLADADKTITLTPEQAAQEGHPEWANTPLTQRTLGLLRAATIKGTAQENTGAGHDAAHITTTGMNNATSTANTATRVGSNESIAEARDKTQRLLGELRASVSTANNERTNQTHLTTSGLRSAGAAAGQPGNYKVPADVTKRASLAANVQENAGEVSKLLDSNPDIVGAVQGRFTNAEQMIGNDNPAISALGTRIHNIALAANGAHGVRSQEAVHATEREILNNFHNGPNAIKGALNATTSSVQTFIEDEKNFRQTGGRVPPASAGADIPSGNIKVQLPDGRSGHISAGQKDKFLKDHPGAKVL